MSIKFAQATLSSAGVYELPLPMLEFFIARHYVKLALVLFMFVVIGFCFMIERFSYPGKVFIRVAMIAISFTSVLRIFLGMPTATRSNERLLEGYLNFGPVPGFIDGDRNLQLGLECFFGTIPNCKPIYPFLGYALGELNGIRFFGTGGFVLLQLTLTMSVVFLAILKVKSDFLGLLIALFTVSPAFIFALERANVDLLILTCLCLGYLSLKKSRLLPYPSQQSTMYLLAALFFFSIAIQTKVFPIAALIVVTYLERDLKRKVVLCVTILFNSFLGILLLGWGNVLGGQLRVGPTCVGFPCIPKALEGTYSSITYVEGFISLKLLSLLVMLIYVLAVFCLRNIVGEEIIFALSIYVPLWFVTDSFAYKNIFLILLVVALVNNLDQKNFKIEDLFFITSAFVNLYLFSSDLTANLLFLFSLTYYLYRKIRPKLNDTLQASSFGIWFIFFPITTLILSFSIISKALKSVGYELSNPQISRLFYHGIPFCVAALFAALIYLVSNANSSKFFTKKPS